MAANRKPGPLLGLDSPAAAPTRNAAHLPGTVGLWFDLPRHEEKPTDARPCPRRNEFYEYVLRLNEQDLKLILKTSEGFPSPDDGVPATSHNTSGHALSKHLQGVSEKKSYEQWTRFRGLDAMAKALHLLLHLPNVQADLQLMEPHPVKLTPILGSIKADFDIYISEKNKKTKKGRDWYFVKAELVRSECGNSLPCLARVGLQRARARWQKIPAR